MAKASGQDQSLPTGQRANVDHWVDTYGDVLFRYAVARVRDRHAAEDLVQTTFLAALEGNAGFRGDSAERTWLVGILRHKILDHLRRQGRERSASASDRIDDDSHVDQAFNDRGMWRRKPGRWRMRPDQLAEQEEFQAVLDECIGHLPDRQAQAFTLKVVDGGETDQTCKAMGIQPTNLWVMLHRARTRLRECLEAMWFSRDERKGR